LVLFFMISVVPPVLGQEIGGSVGNQMPFLRAGFLYGRIGVTKGPSGYLEVNPSRWLGVCTFVARSRSTHEIEEGGHAKVSDFSVGGCVTAHLPERQGFLLSPFVQMAYQYDHIRVTLPLGDGTTYQEAQDHKRLLWTIGATMDRAIVKNGPRWVARIGRNFGEGPAVENAGGVYVTGGVIFPLSRPGDLGRSFRRIVGRKATPAVSAATRP
jgi:hypothetical protein